MSPHRPPASRVHAPLLAAAAVASVVTLIGACGLSGEDSDDEVVVRRARS